MPPSLGFGVSDLVAFHVACDCPGRELLEQPRHVIRGLVAARVAAHLPPALAIRRIVELRAVARDHVAVGVVRVAVRAGRDS
jgi:hypothetical protein